MSVYIATFRDALGRLWPIRLDVDTCAYLFREGGLPPADDQELVRLLWLVAAAERAGVTLEDFGRGFDHSTLEGQLALIIARDDLQSAIREMAGEPDARDAEQPGDGDEVASFSTKA